MAAALQSELSQHELKIDIQEAKLVGTFDVFLDDELVYSKNRTGRVPHPGEVEEIIESRIN